MNPLQALLDSRNHKVLSIKDIVTRAEKENRPMTPDEISLFDRLEEEVKDLNTKIQAQQDHTNRMDRLNQIQADLDKPAGRKVPPDQPGSASPSAAFDDTPRFKIPATARKTRSLKAFRGQHAEHHAYKCGMWARAVLLRDEKAVTWCINHGMAHNISNAAGTSSNTAGGFLVPDEMSNAIIDLREQYGVFRQNCNVVPMGRDTITIPRRLGGVTIGPLGENPAAAPTDTNPTWNNVQLTAKKAGGLSKMSTEIAEDAIIDLGDWIADEYAYAFANFEDRVGFTGTGISTDLGIRGLANLLTVASGLVGAVAATTATIDTFAEVDVASLAAVMAKLPAYAKMNAKWYCSSTFDEMVFGRLLAGAGGNRITDVEGGRPMRQYMGYPIVISQVLPDGIATDYSGVAMCFFGDLRKSSSLGDRREVRIMLSEHRFMDTDQIGILGTERIDIVNHDIGTTTVAGPIVALCGGAS